MSNQPTILINGNRLTDAEVHTLRAAIDMFLSVGQSVKIVKSARKHLIRAEEIKALCEMTTHLSEGN
jgi:hypothetical protein